jgi:hypothetical protein
MVGCKKKKKKVVAIHGARRCVASTGGTAQDISGQDKEIPQAPCQLGRFASPGCRKWQGASINFECFMLTRADNAMVNDAPLYRTVRTRGKRGGSVESRISIRFQTGMETQHSHERCSEELISVSPTCSYIARSSKHQQHLVSRMEPKVFRN